MEIKNDNQILTLIEIEFRTLAKKANVTAGPNLLNALLGGNADYQIFTHIFKRLQHSIVANC